MFADDIDNLLRRPKLIVKVEYPNLMSAELQ